jgi:uncharacterized RDD family membrane protein YckC
MCYKSGMMKSYSSQQTKRMKELQGAPLAVFGRRAIAFMLDLLAMSFLFAVLVGSCMLLLLKLGWVQRTDRFSFAVNFNTHGLSWVNWYSIAWAVLYFGLFTYFGRGRTPGKWLMGIRVISLAHERISLWHSIERALGYGASLLEFGFGFAQYFVHPNRQTVHDRIAQTIVIRDRRASKDIEVRSQKSEIIKTLDQN